MEYSYLGSTGLRVSRLCLGTMTFSRGDHYVFGPKESGATALCGQEEAEKLMDRFVEAGGNFIDTADCYSGGAAEELVGWWLKKRERSSIVVATKLGIYNRPGDLNSPGLSRQNILRSVEESLSRLQTSYIDLLYTHVWDYGTPLEETLETLHWLVQQGKVRYVGGSNMTGWQVQLAASLAKQEGIAKYSVLQQQYSLLCREPEWEVLEVAAREGVGILPWSPLKGGWLSGKMSRKVGEPPEGSRVQLQSAPGAAQNVQSGPNWSDMADKEKTWRVLDEVASVAKEKGKSVAQIALRWLLDKNNVPSVVIGVKTLDQLEDNLAAVGWSLTKEEMERLDAASALPAPYPYEMINRLNKDRRRI